MSDLVEALELLAKIVSIANISAIDGDDGFVERYDMPVGPIHRAIGFIQQHGYVVSNDGTIHRPKAADSDNEPLYGSAEWWARVDARTEQEAAR